MYKYYQPNKKDLKDDYGDCVIRALTKAFDMQWRDVFIELAPIALELQCMPNGRPCYEKYITEIKGFTWYPCKAIKGKKRPTVETFAKQHKLGTYILRCAHHLVTVVDGNWYDTWESDDCSVYGYWTL